MARPKKQLDKDTFEKLCGLHCTKEEIQAWFDVSDKTIDRWVRETYGEKVSFSEVYRQKKSSGKISLRRKQYEAAMAGNTTLLIWLGKQYLGQSDKQENLNIEKIQINIDKDDSDL
jgi:transposase